MPFKLNDESRDLLIALAVVAALALLMSHSHYAGFSPPVDDYHLDDIEFDQADEELD